MITNSSVFIIVLLLFNTFLIVQNVNLKNNTSINSQSSFKLNEVELNELIKVIGSENNTEIIVNLIIPDNACITCLVNHVFYDQILRSSIGSNYEVIGITLTNESTNDIIQPMRIVQLNDYKHIYPTNKLTTIVSKKVKIIDYHVYDQRDVSKTNQFYDRLLSYLNIE